MRGLIFGYTWEQIQRAQQKLAFRQLLSGKPSKPLATAADYALLREHGEAGLSAMGYYGVLDRLRNAAELAKREEV